MKMSSKKIVGAILAAGKGSRIKPLNLHFPKPLLPIGNKPIMEYQIEEMKRLGINEIYVVVGHLGTKIKKYFGNGKKLGVKITYVKQKEKLGIAHAVGQLEPYIKNPFLLFLGDIFYVPKNLKKMVMVFRKNGAGGVLAVKKETDPESIKRNFSLIIRKNNLIQRVIEKPRYVVNDLKGCGIYLFDLPIFDAIRNTPRTAMRDEYEITNSIQLLIDYGYKVYAIDVVSWDMNITFAQDLLECNLQQLKRMRKSKLIDATAKVRAPEMIKASIIGPKVIISQPVSITNSVVFKGVKIDDRKEILNSIVTDKKRFKVY